MIQLHSTPISETLAHICGLIAGLAAYGLTSGFTTDHKLRMHIGIITSVLVNALVGGKINVVMHDFLALLIVRPLSAYLGAKLLEYVTAQMGW